MLDGEPYIWEMLHTASMLVALPDASEQLDWEEQDAWINYLTEFLESWAKWPLQHRNRAIYKPEDMGSRAEERCIVHNEEVEAPGTAGLGAGNAKAELLRRLVRFMASNRFTAEWWVAVHDEKLEVCVSFYADLEAGVPDKILGLIE